MTDETRAKLDQAARQALHGGITKEDGSAYDLDGMIVEIEDGSDDPAGFKYRVRAWVDQEARNESADEPNLEIVGRSKEQNEYQEQFAEEDEYEDDDA